MTTHIELTAEQAATLADLTARTGHVYLHQLAPPGAIAGPSDVYVTPHDSATGFRVAVDGAISPIGETLPAAG
jgi:hypothetical protein